MSPRKSGHWASLQQAMNPVQNQEENNQTVPAEEQNANPSVENPSTSQPDDFEIPRDAFSLFDDEETAVSEPDAAEENQNDELLLDETEEPPAKESEYKWNAVEIKGNDPVEKTLDGDFEIPADAFSMFDDEDEQPKPKAKKTKKQSAKDAVKAEAQPEPAAEVKEEKPEKARKPRKTKKSKSAPAEEADAPLEVKASIPEEQISESFAAGVMDDSVIHSAATETPAYFPVHQIEVAPVAIDQPEPETTQASESDWSATSLLDDLIPDSEIDRVNLKAAKKEKKNAKKAAKSAPVEEKPVEKAPEPKILDDDFDIPADAFSMFDDEDEQPKPKAKKPAKKEKPVKAEKPVEAPAAKDDDFDIPADAFSMFDDEDEPQKAPKAKPEKAEKREKKADKKEKKLEKRAKKEEQFEDDVEEFAVKSFEEVGDYEERPRRQPKQKPARERRYEEDAPEPREYREPRESRESADVREGEPRRPAINIPSWREVMDMLVEMNMNRRKASERPSRQEKRSRSAAERQREIEEIEDRFEREDVAPRRRRRRPE